jgi:hypothetical protein
VQQPTKFEVVVNIRTALDRSGQTAGARRRRGRVAPASCCICSGLQLAHKRHPRPRSLMSADWGAPD